jgi:hypothetical protein
MRRELGDGYDLDDDPGRIQLDAVHEFLTRAYWSEGRSRETQAELNALSARLVASTTTASRSASRERC